MRRRCVVFVDGLVSAIALWFTWAACEWMADQHIYGEHTLAQRTLGVIMCVAMALWAAAEVERRIVVRDGNALVQYDPVAQDAGAHVESSKGNSDKVCPEPTTIGATERHAHKKHRDEEETTGDSKDGASPSEATSKAVSSAPAAAADHAPSPALLSAPEALAALRAMAELGAILAYLYCCDRTDLFNRADKFYNRYNFWGVWAIICIAALATCRKLETSKPLQREQTDEWKGWMQIMFLMYHYFAEVEIYNAIRIYIAAYVWMTGFGNLSLYAKGKAFTTRRTLQMLFRLNFLGFVVCIALNNEYMLYYICAMHTFFTVLVALAMYIWQEGNASIQGVHSKLLVLFILTVVIYDGPDFIFRGIFGMLPGVRTLFAFHDPVHPEFIDEMHEWHFRSGLDRFIWIIGMLQALYVPRFAEFISSIESMTSTKGKVAAEAALIGAVLVPFALWYWFVFRLEKYSYNGVHPYTSWIPLSCFLVLRNAIAPLRQRYLWLFAYLGKTTLETYILQFHIWMKTTGLNGSPKHLLEFVPDIFWINLAMTTTVYLALSIRLFHITVVLRDAMIPESITATAKRWGIAVVVSAVSALVAVGVTQSEL